jgi:hypothetical protein
LERWKDPWQIKKLNLYRILKIDKELNLENTERNILSKGHKVSKALMVEKRAYIYQE